MRACVRASERASERASVRVYVCACVRACVCVCVCVCVRAFAFVYVYICMYVGTCVSVDRCTRTSVYITRTPVHPCLSTHLCLPVYLTTCAPTTAVCADFPFLRCINISSYQAAAALHQCSQVVDRLHNVIGLHDVSSDLPSCVQQL